MYVRLAFAVSAHLEPEILIVDEVLAVGDTEFQQKCLGKMREAGAGGRTVLFVSHNMGAISELCNRAILLKEGEREFEGDSDLVIDHYLAGASRGSAQVTFPSSCGRFELLKPYWISERGDAVAGVRFGEDCTLRFEFLFHEKVGRINPGIALRDMSGRLIFVSHLVDDPACDMGGNLQGKVVIETRIGLPSLAPGLYGVVFGVRDEAERTVIYAENELFLEITSHGPRKNGAGGLLWHTTVWRVSQCGNDVGVSGKLSE
jgi:lipopolysaccharide transport system ATP-binding protein